jgi:hypothetical protein
MCTDKVWWNSDELCFPFSGKPGLMLIYIISENHHNIPSCLLHMKLSTYWTEKETGMQNNLLYDRSTLRLQCSQPLELHGDEIVMLPAIFLCFFIQNQINRAIFSRNQYKCKGCKISLVLHSVSNVTVLYSPPKAVGGNQDWKSD